jgi:hypothetical protein
MTTQNETEVVETVKRAMCKSRTCEGANCCQWPANMGRTKCPVRDGGYDDAAADVITALTSLGFSRRADVVEECAVLADRMGDKDCGCRRCEALHNLAESIRSLSPQSKDTIPVIRFGDETK